MKTRLFPLLGPMAPLALVLFSTGGCNSAPMDAKSAHDQGRGNRKEYEATFDQAWAAAHAAIQWNHVGAAQDHADDHYIITDAARYDQIGIWIDPEGANKTLVNVVVIDDPNLNGPNEEGVQKDIAKAIDLIKDGQPVDKRPKGP